MERPGCARRRRRYSAVLAFDHFEIEYTPKADFTAAQAIFRRYDELSFVAATFAAYMDREDVDHRYSLRDDSDPLDGATRLDTAEDP